MLTFSALIQVLALSVCVGTQTHNEEYEGPLTYLHYPRFHFAGRFRADTATINNFPNNYDTANFDQSDQQQNADNWNPLGSGEWAVEAEVTQVCYSDLRCEGNQKMDTLIGAGITGGGIRVPAKLVDLDPQAHKFEVIWGWTILVGGFLSADFVPAPTQYRWVKIANSSHGTTTDADQGAAWQSILTNIIWNETITSPILEEMRPETNKSGNLSIRFNVDGFNESPSDSYFGWGRITGTIGLANSQSYAFTTGGRVLKALTEGLQDAPFIFDKKAKRVTIDFGNSLPILKNGSHNVTFIDKLVVAIPKNSKQRPLSYSCDDGILPIGVVLYRLQNWYQNTAGIQSFPSIGVLPEQEINLLNNTPLIIIEAEGIWPAVQCKRILFSEASDGIQVHPMSSWVIKAEPGDDINVTLLATKFGLPVPGINITIRNFVCPKIFYENGGPNISTDPLPFSNQTLVTDLDGSVFITSTARDPMNPRSFIDGQVYPYLYWPESHPIDEKKTCKHDFLYLLNSYIVIRIFDNYTYGEPPTWTEDVKPIFQQYATLFPVMTKSYVDLGNYHEVIKEKFHINITLGLPQSNPNHMPVTRDLSKGKRDMILKWLDYPCYGLDTVDFTIEKLRQNLQTALEIEHATIPTYLTALATIKGSYNTEVQAIFRQIILQEMLHMALAANMLNAIGGEPVLFSKNFLPLYPTALPGGLMPGLTVPIQKCSISLISNIFMEIEQPSVTEDKTGDGYPETKMLALSMSSPESPHIKVTGKYKDGAPRNKKDTCKILNPNTSDKKQGSYPNAHEKGYKLHYNTIGEFYDNILLAFTILTKNGTNNSIFIGNSSKQLFWPGNSFGRRGHLINVTDYNSTKQAIQEIIREGEGSSPCNPLDWWKINGSDLSHYFLFKSIVEQHQITVHESDEVKSDEDEVFQRLISPFGKKCGANFSFNGTKIRFDDGGVWNMVNDPRLVKFKPGSRADVLNREFNRLYTNLLRSLHVVFNGYPDKFNDALGLMFSIDRHLKTLVSTPLDEDGDPTVGPNAGPTFEFMPD